MTTMSGALKNSITASMGRSGLRGGGAKSTTDFGCCKLLSFGLLGREKPRGGHEYSTAVTPSPSPAAGGGDDDITGVGADADDEGRGGRQA
jgi:hypothetical protein